MAEVKETQPPKEAPQTSEDKVKARLGALEAAEAGKCVRLEKTNYLVEYMRSKGISEKEIESWNTFKCWDKAAELLDLERRRAPRSEPEGARVLREQIEALQQEVAKMRQKLAKLDELEEKFAQTEADKALLLKALKGGELSEEEEEKLTELKGEAPPALEEAEEETSTKSAVDQALDELLAKYAPDKEKEGRGRIRGAVLPIVGAIGGGRVAQFTISALEGLGRVPIPVFAAITAGVSSLVTSRVRSLIGENAFSLWARYSHTEGKQGRFGKVVKLGQMFTRGAERAVLKRMFGLTGSEEVRRLLEFYDEKGNFAVPENLGNQMYIEGLVREGMWYGLGTEAARLLGAYYTPQEIKEITNNRPRVIRAVNELVASNYIPEDQREALLQRIKEELIGREKGVYATEAVGLAVIGAAKAATLSQVGIWAAEQVAPKVFELFHPPTTGAVPPEEVAVPPVIPPETIPGPERVLELRVTQTVGHTLVENRIPPEWGNLDPWQLRLLANDTENPNLWENAAKMARAIVENPDRHLAGLSEETRKATLVAAQRTVVALKEGGYNEVTHSLDNPSAVLGDLQKIKDLFHWVRPGQIFFEPVR